MQIQNFIDNFHEKIKKQFRLENDTLNLIKYAINKLSDMDLNDIKVKINSMDILLSNKVNNLKNFKKLLELS